MAVISVGFTPESEALFEQWDRVDTELLTNLDDAFGQFLEEVEGSIISQDFAGGPGKGGGQTPIGNRTGALRQSIRAKVDGPLRGFVGSTRGPASAYARSILGPGKTTIRPRSARKLWVPVAQNLNPSGVARYTPKELFDQFGDRIRIFTSRRGNTVVFVEDERNEDGSRARYKRAAGARVRGDAKGKLYFVLKDQIVIQGTNALAEGAARMLPRGEKLIADAIAKSFPGGGA